jgi:hypothetical protein
MADNNRIFYAIQQVAIGTIPANTYQVLKGVQSVSMTTTFNLEQAFQLGQLEIYENIEGVPSIEMTINRLLDGTALAYVLACGDNQTTCYNNAQSLVTASKNTFMARLGIWDEEDNPNGVGGTANPVTQVSLSGCVLSSVNYTFGVDGNFTEEISITATDKAWYGQCVAASGWSDAYTAADSDFTNNDTPDFAGGVQRREYLDTTGSLWPGLIPEGSGRIQSVTVSTDFGTEDLFQLGSKGPFAKVASFPIEVTCSIEVLSQSGDLVDAAAEGCTATTQCEVKNNLNNEPIRINLCDGTVVDLGIKNKLSSVSYGGGDAGGGNVTTTFDFTNFNSLSVSGTGAISFS